MYGSATTRQIIKCYHYKRTLRAHIYSYMALWRDSVLIPIFKNKGDVQSCSNYRGIKLIGHTMKLWERIIERRLRRDLTFSNQQYGFMAGKSTTDALFVLRVLMEKYREGQKELHCVFVDLEKAYYKVPREEV